MFERLKKFNAILVTGPQRSGTTICAKAIVQDTGHSYIDENEILVHSFEQVLLMCDQVRNIVIHCPGVMRYVHLIGDRDDIAVVVMRRNPDDIIASEERIRWDGEAVERRKYATFDGAPVGPICLIKYGFFEEYQRHKIKNCFDVQYESIKEHPLWVTKQLRRRFSARQTEL